MASQLEAVERQREDDNSQKSCSSVASYKSDADRNAITTKKIRLTNELLSVDQDSEKCVSIKGQTIKDILLNCDTLEDNTVAGSRDSPVNPKRTSTALSTSEHSRSPSNTSGVVTGLNEPRLLSYGGSFGDRPGASLPITPENYQSEAERIESFIRWPLKAVHPKQLARVGFVYTGDGALVQCFQCGVKRRCSTKCPSKM